MGCIIVPTGCHKIFIFNLPQFQGLVTHIMTGFQHVDLSKHLMTKAMCHLHISISINLH